jgi:hypothetical protein
MKGAKAKSLDNLIGGLPIHAGCDTDSNVLRPLAPAQPLSAGGRR